MPTCVENSLHTVLTKVHPQCLLEEIQTGTPDYSLATTKTFNKVAIFICKFAVQKLWQGLRTFFKSSFSTAYVAVKLTYMLHVTCYMFHVTFYLLHVTCYMLHVTCSPNVPPSGVLGTSTTVLTSFVKLSDNISKDSELTIIHCLHRTILYYLSQSKPEVRHLPTFII